MEEMQQENKFREKHLWILLLQYLPGPPFGGNEVFLNADSTEDAAIFSYTFGFGKDEVVYQYARFSNQKLRDEELVINGNSIFKCDFFNKEYCFDNLKFIKAETANIDRYMQAIDWYRGDRR